MVQSFYSSSIQRKVVVLFCFVVQIINTVKSPIFIHYFCVLRVLNCSAQALFTVYDGHGKEGDLCAVFCKDTLPGVLSRDLRESRTVEDGLKKAFNRTNDQVR